MIEWVNTVVYISLLEQIWKYKAAQKHKGNQNNQQFQKTGDTCKTSVTVYD